MCWRNYHTHSNFSDGKMPPEPYVKQAIANGMDTIGFSEHAPLPFEACWTLIAEKVPEYLRAIANLKDEYRGQIEVLCSLEVDYIPEKISPIDSEYKQLGLDYIIGSVHFVGEYDIANQWAIDSSDHAKFLKGLKEIYHDDLRELVRQYFHLMRQLLEKPDFDILAHIELICMNADRYFSVEDDWYRREINLTLEAVKASGVILELNTGGIARGRHNDFYLRREPLERANALGIPVLIGADAHHPDQITGKFTEALAMMWEAGFRQTVKFHDGEWVSEAIVR